MLESQNTKQLLYDLRVYDNEKNQGNHTSEYQYQHVIEYKPKIAEYITPQKSQLGRNSVSFYLYAI